jgi:hypothetical protein
MAFYCSKPPGSPRSAPSGKKKLAGWVADGSGGAAYYTPMGNSTVDHCICIHELQHYRLIAQFGVHDSNVGECIAYMVQLACLDRFCGGK